MFFCGLRRSGGTLSETELFGAAGVPRGWRGPETAILSHGPFMVAVRSGPGLMRPLMARHRQMVAVGDVRLDNRAEVARLAGVSGAASDLELVLRALDAQGEKAISELLGDFGLVIWDARAHKLLAIRDAFGVKPLYYRATPELLQFSSRADTLATAERYDVEYIADFLTGLVAPDDRTIWDGVKALPAGGCLLQRGTQARGWRYWSPDAFEPEPHGDAPYYEDQFLTLFRDGVRARLGAPGTTWSQLSGGLDSSSVVAMAQTVGGGRGLAGTLTVVDTLGAGDERRYVDSVLRRYDLRNEQVRDQWAWQHDDDGPPGLDVPRPLFPFWARDRRVADVVRRAGGRVLLSGFGSDHYLMGNLNYIADAASRGRLGLATKELTRWAVAMRQSFWGLAREHVVAPVVGGYFAGRRAVPNLPSWVATDFAARTKLHSRVNEATASAGPRGGLFAARIARDVAAIPSGVDRWPFGEDIEVRYPFLHRPLVEACLKMPAAMRIRPAGTKWVLRQAMRGMLPEDVRTRASKGLIDARILWSLNRERGRIDRLLHDPLLAQMGCIDPEALRRDVDAARRGEPVRLVMLMSVLSLETWLAVRNGRWSELDAAAQSAA